MLLVLLKINLGYFVKSKSSSSYSVLKHPYSLLLYVSLATSLVTIDLGVVSVALPHMLGTFSTTFNEISWILTLYTITTALTIPALGFLAKIFGRKKVFLLGIIGFTLMSMLSGLSYSFEQIIFCRSLQGIFSAPLVAMSQAIILDAFDEKNRGKAMSLWTFGLLLGPILGPLAGGYLTGHFGWRWIFFINLPIGLIAAIGIINVMKEDLVKLKQKIDFFGLLFLGTAAGSLQIFLDRGEISGWFDSNLIKTLLIVSVIFAILFLTRNITAKFPLIPKLLFKDRSYIFGLIFVFLFGIILVPPFILIPPMLTDLGGFPVEDIGYAIAPSGLGGMLGSILAGRLITGGAYRTIMFIALILYSFSAMYMATWTPSVSMEEIIINGFIRGMGIGMFYVPLATATYLTLPINLRNEGTSLFQFIRNFGSGLTVAFMATTLSRFSEINTKQLNTLIIKGGSHWDYLRSINHEANNLLDPIVVFSTAVQHQSLMTAFGNNFILMGVIPLLFLPLLYFFHPKQTKIHS